MKRWIGSTLALALVIGLAGCGESGTADADEAATERVAKATGAEPAMDDAPCEILSDDLIGSHFDLAGAEINRSPSEYSPHPFCTASWPKPNAAEIQKRREEMRVERIRKRMQGEEVEPLPRARDEVSLTINRNPFDDRDEAIAAFDRAIRVLTEGMTVETDAGSTETPTYDVEPVEGVGLKAMWVPRLHQLSVATAERIFHVGVRVDGGLEREREKAKALARDIAATL